MSSTARNRPARRRFTSFRSRALLLGIVGTAALFAAPAGTQAASRSTVVTSSVCSKVSPAAVSAIVGHSVPAATSFTQTLKATKQNFNISAVVTTCTFGAQTNVKALLKDVTLSLEITSKPLTAFQAQQEIAKASGPTLKFKFTPYSGLGVPAYYFSMTAAGISAEGIEAVSGTKIFGASVETKTLSKSKLAALAKLAGSL